MTSILIIEDEPSILANTIDILRFEGYDVAGARSGQTGVDLAEAQRPDLILCDMMMPGMDGYAVLNTIRANPMTSDVPLVLMSARVDNTTINEVMGRGASNYLPKPFTMPELLSVVRRCLDDQ